MDKHITIIGGSGFIGTNLIQELNNYNVLNLDLRDSIIYNHLTNFTDIEKISTINIPKFTDTVILLAAEHKDNISPFSRYYDVNVEGTRNVLIKMEQLGISNLIFTSSVAVYGLEKDNPNEFFNPDPYNHYGKSKLNAEKLIYEWYYKNPSIRNVTIIRPTVVFGENNRGNVYNLLKQMNSNKFLMIGAGNNIKSMAYVKNLVGFIKKIIESKEKGFEIYNYSDVPDITMSALLNLVYDKLNKKKSKIFIPYYLGLFIGYVFDIISFLLQKDLKISAIRIKKFCKTTQFDSTKAHSKFIPPYTLQEGIIRTLIHEFNKK